MSTLAATDNNTLIKLFMEELSRPEIVLSRDDQHPADNVRSQCTFPVNEKPLDPSFRVRKMRRPSPIELRSLEIDPKLASDLFAVTPLTKMIIELPSPRIGSRNCGLQELSPLDTKTLNTAYDFERIQDLLDSETPKSPTLPSRIFNLPKLSFSSPEMQLAPEQRRPISSPTAPEIIESPLLERNTKNHGSSKISDAVKNIRAILLPNGRYKCSECSRTYKHAKHVRRHSTVHALNRHDLYTCQQCFHKFTRCDALTRHLKSHEKPRRRPSHVRPKRIQKPSN